MKEWHCVLFGQVQGPFLEDRLKEMAAAGEIAPDTLVWSGSTQEDASLGWRQASETELAALFNAAYPPQPPTPPPLPPELFSAGEEGASEFPSNEREPLPKEAGGEVTRTDASPALAGEHTGEAPEARGEQEKEKTAPQAETLPGGAELASRLRRLLGFVLETFVGYAFGLFIGFLAAFLIGLLINATSTPAINLFYFSHLRSLSILAAILVYFALSLYFLHRDGQSISKKILGIRIVNKDGSRAPLWKIIVLRNGIQFVLTVCLELAERTLGRQEAEAISILLISFVVVDSLFIFRKDRRTLHDLLAGTTVVKKGPKPFPTPL